MESLICEPGPRNPLLFLALSVVNRVPGYNPDDNETLNQIECIKDLINSVSASVFRLETTKNAVAVALDALMTVSAVEAKKSIAVRVSALECMNLLIEKMTACGINSLIGVLPGVLSRMIKISTGRVDVEITRIIQLSLKIIKRLLQCFWSEQYDWKSEESCEKFVILKQKYKENIDIAISSLRPLVKSQRVSEFDEDLMDIFEIQLNENSNPSVSCLKLYLLLLGNYPKPRNFIVPQQKNFTQLYNTEIVEWFDINLDTLKSVHEEVLLEKLQLIFGLIKTNGKFLMVSDLFLIIKKLTEIKMSSGADIISIEYSDSPCYGIQNYLTEKVACPLLSVPIINFKRSLKCSKEFSSLLSRLLEKVIQLDAEVVQNLLLRLEDTSIEEIIQKIDLASVYYANCNDFSIFSSLDLFEDCLKYHERTFYRVEEVQMIHLATLKLLWSCQYASSSRFPQFNAFDKISRGNILIILSGMANEWIILRESSTQILRGIAKIIGKTVKELIKENCQFILDRLGMQLALPSLFPSAPQIISCLVHQIVDPFTALKFTDLLVKKVSDNLSVYQKHSAYCKDLISVAKETVQVISKTDPIEFVDPKDFAFMRKEADDEESGVKAIPLNCQQRIICDLLRIGTNFILSDFKSIRSKSIELIEAGVNNFTKDTSEPSELCQLIHVAWPFMISVLKESINREPVQLDVLVIESFSNCCQVLFERLPLFMRDRFVKDLWRSVLKNYRIPSLSASSSAIKIGNLLLETLNYGLIHCKPSTEICLEILAHPQISDKLIKSIQLIEPDIVWYYYSIELGQLEEIKSNYPELKSFKLQKSKKQFII